MITILSQKSLSALIGLALLLTLVACIGQPQPEPATVQSSVKRETAPAVTEIAQVELSASNRAFAFDLYQALRGEDGNLFYSPHSISIALAMTYAGARENTAQQMAETLHFTLPSWQLHPAFNALDLSLTKSDTGAFTLTDANALWGQTGYTFRPEFLDMLALNYGAGLQLLDYVDEGKREQSRLTINRWVSDQTAGKIEELLKKGVLTKDTRLVLTNAIYFKAEWDIPFYGTRDAPFTLLDGSQINIPTMSRRAGAGYAEDEGYQAVELLYKGGRMRMVILLPSPGQFEAFESALTGERVAAILQVLEPHDLKLYMPKFGYDASLSLGDTLAQMGMPDAFTPRVADFSGMDGTRDLLISDVVHQAFVAVDEIGTEAAAATGVIMEIESMPTEVRLDRPFIFLIHDMESDAILFVGRLADPR